VLISITQFIGRLHPAIIHLPVGILLTALLLQWLVRRPKYKALQPAVPIVLLAGSFSALLSCITGYILSSGDDYDKNLVSWHLWMGIGTTMVSFMLYAKEKNPQFGVNKTLLSTGLLVLVFATGHLGGSLTHGSDYFTKPLADVFGSSPTASNAIKPIANVQEAVAYTDIVAPLLQAKCYACHGAEKQKGHLRLDDSSFIFKGGKNGAVIKPGNGDASEMIKRMLLPLNDDDHMPPKEKPQPTAEQIALLHWWIDNNASFSSKVKQLNQPANVKTTLLGLQKAPQASGEANYLPQQSVEPADEKIVKNLASHGIVVIPVAQNSNYLLMNFVTDTIVGNDVLALMVQLKKQLAWVKLNNTNINDAAMPYLAQLTALTKLDVGHTHITDNGLQQLRPLLNLQYLNLAGTAVTEKGLIQLKALKKLRAVYLFQTQVNKTAYPLLKTNFPHTTIDTGGYNVPILETDTTEVKAKKEY
jgi:mono/diheme cytochrome c family protein